MKRIFRYILSLAASVAAAAGCMNEPVVRINPDEVIVPVLHDPGFPEVITITSTNQSEQIVFTWDAANVGFGAQINYALEMYVTTSDEDGNIKESAKTAVTGGVAATTAEVNYEDLNYSLVYSLGAVPLEPVTVNFCLSASVGVRKFYSEPLTVVVVPTNAEKLYPHIYFIGSYCDWQHSEAQLLYDYSENGIKYQGVIDFGEEFMTSTFQGFKLTAKDNWTEGEWGDPMKYDKTVDYDNLPKNPEEVVMATGGAGGDCYRYNATNRFYHFSFSKDKSTLKMDAAFNGAAVVIGGETLPLSFHGTAHHQKFYVDVVVKSGDTFKVVLDDEKTAFGADDRNTEGLLVLAEPGQVKEAESRVEAGSYRLYINMNDWDAVTYEFNPDNFGTEEGGVVVESYKGWGINGNFNDWIGDIPMEYDGESWYVAKGVSLRRDDDFKFRLDGRDLTTFQGGGFAVNKATWQEQSGRHIIVTEDGIYDIYLNITNGCCWFCTNGAKPSSGSSVQRPESMSFWSICGTFNNWSDNGEADYWMEQKGDWFIAKEVAFAAGDEFKFRYLYRWDVSTKVYEGEMSVDTAYPLIDGLNKGNAKVTAEGVYDVYMSYKYGTVCLMTPGEEPLKYETPKNELEETDVYWTIIGTFSEDKNVWSDKVLARESIGADEDGNGGKEYYVIRDLSLKANDEFKFRYRQNWEWANVGCASSPVEKNCCYNTIRRGDNFKIKEDGIYDIYVYSADMSLVYVMEAGVDISQATDKIVHKGWAVATSANNWGDIFMEDAGDWYMLRGLVLATNTEFKFKFGNWENYLRSVGDVVIGKTLDVSKADGNMTVSVAGTYDIYLSKNLKTMAVMPEGEIPVMVEKVAVKIYGESEDRKNLYVWHGSNSVIGAQWPGNMASGTETINGCTFNVWTLMVEKELLESETKVQFIFNTGDDSKKTQDSDAIVLTEKMYLTISENKPVLKDMTQVGPGEDGGDGNGDEDVTPSEGRTVTVYSASQNLSNLYMWVEGGICFTNEWPGDAGQEITPLTHQGMTYYYKWEFTNVTELSAQMILNNGTTQTENSEIITLDDEVYISHRSAWVDDQEKHYVVWERNKVEITILSETSYTRLYGWWANGGEWAGTWPGTESSGIVTEDGKTYRKWNVWVDEQRFNAGEQVCFVLSDGSSQTVDSEPVTLSEKTIIVAPAKKN